MKTGLLKLEKDDIVEVFFNQLFKASHNPKHPFLSPCPPMQIL